MAHRASSSSMITYKWTSDVYLSYYGKDTRFGFTGHLYRSLQQRGIRVCIDNEAIGAGELFTPSLFRAIEESRIAIIVFSENYANSTFCLQELEKIIKSFKEESKLIYPVFYNVDPSELRRPRGSYAQALARLEERFKDDKDKVEKWRHALSQAADLRGLYLKSKFSNEHEWISRITNEVATRIGQVPLHVTNYPVGLVSRVKEVISCLDLKSTEKIKMIGIWGAGGIGKSTIARAIYNSIADNFEGLCFLSNVRKQSEMPDGLLHLQETLLNRLVMETNLKLGDYHAGIPIIKPMLSEKRILLILDDVDKLDQLEALAGSCDWFGYGSRIIITTRDKQLLKSHGVKSIYDVNELDDNESIKLLSWHAFKKENVDSNYMVVFDRAIHYLCGFPLVLEVIGSTLHGEGISHWSYALDQLKRTPHKSILDALKLSYDMLGEEEKQVFLDLVCFFNGEKLAYVIDILLGVRGIHPKYAIGSLIDKSFIKIEQGHVTMHELIEDLGKEIVRQESPNEPGKRSRLWFHQDILHVLQQNTGTTKVEGIILDVPDETIEAQWSGETFMKMKNFKLLNACFSKCPKYLDLSYNYNSLLQPLNKDFHNLTCMNLTNCRFLRQIPDFSGVPNLRKLCLDDCEKLIEIHDSVGHLTKLRELSAIRCKNLKILPSCLWLPSLRHLNLFGCSSLQKFPEISNIMEEMQTVYLGRTGITELPPSICNLIRRKILELEECRNEPWKMSVQNICEPHLPHILSTQQASGTKSKHPIGPQREGENSGKSNVIGKLNLEQDVLRLMRIRDLLHLILSYPMRIGYEEFLKQWINDVYSQELELLSLAYFNSLGRRAGDLPYDESSLRYVQVLVPVDITEKIINGVSLITKTTLKYVPQPILLLATRLAIRQLTQTLTSYDKIRNIWFSVRDDAEKQTVVENIQADSQIHALFDDLQIIHLNQIDDETKRELVLSNLESRLEQTTSAKFPTENYGRQLVLVVDGDGDRKLDPQKVILPFERSSQHVMVFITTLSSIDYLTNNKVDLTIKTEDHLLPWEVFCKIVGTELLQSSSHIQRIAVEIVEKCGGHLLAIILMAKSLKHVTDVQIWEVALQKLLYRDREAIVNAFFHIIWAMGIRKGEKVRLLRCLDVFKFPDYEKVSDYQLFDRWLSEQLVDTEEAESTLRNFIECSLLLPFVDQWGLYNIQLPEDIRIILHALREEVPKNLNEAILVSTISDLQVLNLSYTHMQNLYDATILPLRKELNLDGCMLETLPKAIFKNQKLETLSLRHCSQLSELPPQIAKLGNLVELRLEGCELLETLPQQIWELPNLEICNLSGTHITHLPQVLYFPKLRSLLLGNNLNLMKIPSSLFDRVPLLGVLDLSRTSIHELPVSIFNLKELRELYLKDCELFVELPPQISRLRNLTTLDLDGTLITHFPEEIQELSNLENLSVSFYNDSSNHDSRSAMIPFGVLLRLTRLKVLRIAVNSDNEWWFKNFEVILCEIHRLEMLQALDMYIPRDEFSPPMNRHLSNFQFIIGYHKPRMISRLPPSIEVTFKESSPSLKFINGQDFPCRVKSILSEAWAFFLDRHMTINNLTQFGLKNLKKLRLCILAECNEMQSIIDMDEHGADSSDLKESLCIQFLTIFYMKNLRTIINNSIFCELKLLALHTCPELTTIFTIHSLNSLVNLEELIVEDCPKVSSIIICPSSQRSTDFFLPRLRRLSLLFVPELSSISNGVFIGRNLEQMGLYYCPKLQSLSTKELSSEKLKEIRGEMEWWKKLEWSEAEWGQEDPPRKFNEIFSPIDEDLDILTQLTAYELTAFKKR